MGKIFDYDGVPVLHTTSGDLKGYFYDGVYIYKGIPYAYADRFQMPVPSKWDGVKDATNYGFVCPLQNQDTPNGELMVPHRYWPQDEHCQSLNIWTNKLDPEAKKPVLVWFHGGGYAAGSSIEQVAYDGVSIAKKGDSILVSVNHRLNILGYLDLSPFGEKYKNSANAGHADMVAALKWVHDKIALFGGDPENVTIFGQSGGPTSVINASAYGVIDTALKSGAITQVLGAEHGIMGVLNDRLFDMGQEDPEELRLLKYTPSSALGSCRYKIADPELDDTDYKRILEVFKKHDVRYFFYNGGNDSMDTCNKINQYMQSVGYECRVMGVPKTIDNDLFGTDHCPGYASAAKYIATSIMEVYQDAHVYDKGMIVVVEIMGRHAGWLAAASALASEYGAGPDLIYLPETDFSMPKFIEDVKKVYNATGNCIVAVSEGIHYEDGGFVSEAKVAANDGFGHAQLGGLATILAEVLKEETGAKVRGIELNLLQRCAAHLASETDIEESYMAGKVAVENAVNGINGRMIGFERGIQNGKYACRTKLVPLVEVANVEKKIPREWINEEGNGVNHQFIEYALPLIQGEPELPKQDSLPRFVKLKKVLAK